MGVGGDRVTTFSSDFLFVRTGGQRSWPESEVAMIVKDGSQWSICNSQAPPTKGPQALKTALNCPKHPTVSHEPLGTVSDSTHNS